MKSWQAPFYSKTADKIGDVMVWLSLAGFALGVVFFIVGGRDTEGVIAIISATSLGLLSGVISAKGRREERMLDRK